MFNSREEGEKFINESKWESEKDKQNAVDRLNRAFPKEEIKYPKGTSKEYTDRVNDAYNKSLPILEKAGIKLEDFKGSSNKIGGFDTNADEIMQKYVFEPFRKKYPNGNNEAWEREYKELYDAIDNVLDKQYNDWYIKNKRD